jgi:spore germination cell wall hydrolase CwlJ-like protein
MTKAAHDGATAAGAAALALFMLAGCQNQPETGNAAVSKGTPAARVQQIAAAKVEQPAAPDILVFRQVEPETALSLNAAMPISTTPIIAARPFRIGDLPDEARAAATDCMTAALFYEAAGEGDAGQKAVAQVVLNRLRHPAFPKTVCDVVFQGTDRSTGCQFTFTCDGSLARLPAQAAWARARRLAEKALAGAVDRQVGLATHYHTQWVVPYWRTDLTKLALVGAHIFYRWQGGWGGPSAFSGRYQTQEALPPKLAASLPVSYLQSVAPGSRLGFPSLKEPTNGDGPPKRQLVADEVVRLPVLTGNVTLVADRNSGRLAADEQSGQLVLK